MHPPPPPLSPQSNRSPQSTRDLEYHSDSVPSSELGPNTPTPSPPSECVPHRNPCGERHTRLRVRGWGRGGPQFGRLEKKPSTLSTLCLSPSCGQNLWTIRGHWSGVGHRLSYKNVFSSTFLKSLSLFCLRHLLYIILQYFWLYETTFTHLLHIDPTYYNRF